LGCYYRRANEPRRPPLARRVGARKCRGLGAPQKLLKKTNCVYNNKKKQNII
jgi:hypothetical protein